MVKYLPILKARQGELLALGQLRTEQVHELTPVMELVPSTDGPVRDAYRFIQHVMKQAPRDLRIAADVGALPETPRGQRCPILDIGEDLANWGIPMAPVIRLHEGTRRLVNHGIVARTHGDCAFVRLGGVATGAPDPDEVERQLPRIWRATGLAPQQCDLLVDMAEVRSERDMIRALPLAQKTVEWALPMDWRSITVASGAMPRTLSRLPTNRPNQLPRWDAVLWQRLRDLSVNYGDYGIANPQLSSVPYPPLANLRYTSDDAWWVYRWQIDGGRNQAFYDLCRTLIQNDHWRGPDFSWGDHQLALRARGVGGPGNPTSWRAWGTSHHVAHVLHNLRHSGSP